MGISLIVAAMLASGSPAAVEQVDVAYAPLAQGAPAAAVEKLENDCALEKSDPARLINLGIAHAQLGNTAEARAAFEAAIAQRERFQLETASGEWVDSRNLARIALAKLDNGEFAPRMASVD